MPRYLSDQWIEALDEAARAHRGLAEATESVAFVIEQVVEQSAGQGQSGGQGIGKANDAPPEVAPTDATATDAVSAQGGAVRWHVVVDHGSVRFVAGPATDPTVRFTTDAATARAISTGAATAQSAFMGGTLRVGGDTGVLIEHHEVLAGLGDVFAAVPIDD